jgi:hypothetical protein
MSEYRSSSGRAAYRLWFGVTRRLTWVVSSVYIGPEYANASVSSGLRYSISWRSFSDATSSSTVTSATGFQPFEVRTSVSAS